MTLRTTPLDAAHRRLGARMLPFAGWDMPVQYAGIVEEHQAVRSSAGLFDVSHMGELDVAGPGALGLLQRITPNDVSRLRVGRAHYSSLLTPAGTIVDDLLVYRRAEERFLVVVNAGNVARDVAWIAEARERLRDDLAGPVTVRDDSEATALLALQGPRSAAIVERLYSSEGGPRPAELAYYGFLQGGTLAGRHVDVLSRTGYTGEDGFEIALAADDAVAAWEALLSEEGVSPVGLGARDTLRLEAGMCLHGSDIDDTTTPIEAGLEWTVKPEKGEFTGRDVLVRQLREGTARRLVGLAMQDRGIARHGHAVVIEGQPAGQVTSGTHSPTLGKAIALAYVPTSRSSPGSRVAVDVRGRLVAAEVVPLPFVKRPKARPLAAGGSP